jgi:hypothetical protein
MKKKNCAGRVGKVQSRNMNNLSRFNDIFVVINVINYN